MAVKSDHGVEGTPPAVQPVAQPVGLLGVFDFSYQHYALGDLLTNQVNLAIMAIEQSIVMGIALAWLFVRALAESESDEQRAERYA